MYSVEQRYQRLKNQLLLGTFTLISLCGIGTAWYVFVEGWSLSDAAYMTMITISTVGFTEVGDMESPSVRFITIALIVLGVINIGYIVNRFTEAMIGGYVQERKKLLEQQEQINRLNNHYIICGFGRTGGQVAKEFTEENIPFIIIDSDVEKINEARELGYVCLQGDATLDQSLLDARIEQAHCLIVALRSDAENLYTVLSAKTINGKIRALARASTEEAVNKLQRAGVESVVSPYVSGGRRLAAAALRPQVMDFVDGILTGSQRSYYLEEIKLDSEFNAYIGQTLSEARLRVQSGALVLAIRRQKDNSLIPGPTGNTQILAGDALICMGTPEQLRALNSILLPMQSENPLRPPNH
ncbi:MAG: potassium channel protein [Limnothrix sp.]